MLEPQGADAGLQVEPILNNGNEPASTTIDLQSLIPEEFKSKPYMQDVKSVDALFKKLDGAQSLLGKRPAGIPTDNSPPEEFEKFYKALGRPDTPDGYEFGTENEKDNPFTTKIKGLFHKAGIPAKQAKILAEGYDAIAKDFTETSTTERDAKFDSLWKETFGDRGEKVTSSTKKILQTMTPPAFKQHVDNLPNESLIVLSAVIDNIAQKYMKEDDILSSNGDGSSMSSADTREEARKLIASEAYNSKFHPDHAATAQKVQELYKKIALTNK